MKKYLKTPEEVLALKDTDTKIYTEGNEGYHQFVKGTLCYFDTDGSIMVSSEFGIGKGFKGKYIIVEEKVTEEDIGKLCWFWDSYEEHKIISTLKSIDSCEYITRMSTIYEHCRRLTPSEVAEITGFKVEES